MSNIIPFESGKLPAYLKKIDVAALNADLTSHAGTGGFPVISIKGKVFAVVRDGERKVLTKDVDGEKIPSPSIDVVLLKANKGNSKVFYAKGYVEGSEGTKPDCFSNTGDKPDASVDSPQSKSCATCPNNQWGSKIGENGGKGKACQDSARLAVATPGQLNDPYLLRVPPASLRSLAEYGDFCKKRGVGYNMVVTRVSFDMEAPTPKLQFKAIGMLDEAGFAQMQESAQSETVQNILGVAGLTAGDAPEVPAVTKPKEVAAPEVEAVAEVKPAPKKKEKAAEEMSVDLDLGNLTFDDE